MDKDLKLQTNLVKFSINSHGQSFVHGYVHSWVHASASAFIYVSEKTVSDTFELERQFLHAFRYIDTASVLC